MKLYTKTGDTGETSLSDGTRVRKDHPRVVACGELDELNATLGWCGAAAGRGQTAARMAQVQGELLAIGAELARPGEANVAGSGALIKWDHCRRLEGWIDEAVAGLDPLRSFLLPGGVELACRLHVARTGCRRAERAVVALTGSVVVREEVLAYLNRLSDLLFAWARRANAEAGLPDATWAPNP